MSSSSLALLHVEPPFHAGPKPLDGLLLARFFELGLDRSGCTRGVASSNPSCRKRTHDRYFTHGTASVMRMCRAGQQMCSCSGPLGSVPGSLSLSFSATTAGDEPRRSCAPRATALARPLLFTGFACHVRVRPSVGHSRTCVLTVTHLFLFLFLLWQNAFASLQPAPASLLPSHRAQCLCNLRRQCL